MQAINIALDMEANNGLCSAITMSNSYRLSLSVLCMYVYHIFAGSGDGMLFSLIIIGTLISHDMSSSTLEAFLRNTTMKQLIKNKS